MRRELLVVAVAGLLVVAGCSSAIDGSDGIEREGAADVSGTLELHHIDVGQADSTLIVTPSNETILIDTGDYRDDGQAVIDYLEAHDIDRIDHLIATHGHADHIGGHPELIEHFEETGDGIGAIYDSGVPHPTATYEHYLDAVEAYNVSFYEVVAGDRLPVAGDGLEATVLNPPDGDASGDIDTNGVVLSLAFGDFSYLTTGDLDASGEQRLVETYGDDLASDAYQAGHHGSSTSSNAPFLDRVDPDIAVVSSPVDSRYGHPHDEVLAAFADRGIETYWTGVHGDIVVTTNGTAASVATERNASTDPATLLERKHAIESALVAPLAHSGLSAARGLPTPDSGRSSVAGAVVRASGEGVAR
ncbi:ComEC/Rec2 family competence protein [Natrinema sp. HArc-T2]|uniref:ComEC/Rec2 family competence protein n=1 Tax=Natrinema sp. HArc-T2 TaxID=3242701 RepID=UPI00359E4BFB